MTKFDNEINKDPLKTVFKDVTKRVYEGNYAFLGPIHILFMKATRCEWGGKCKHCTYWLDNAKSTQEALAVNKELIDYLKAIPELPIFNLKTIPKFPAFNSLSINPSASYFDIPALSLDELFSLFKFKNLICESTWTFRELYQKSYEEMERRVPGIKFYHKMGLETFDDDLRAKIGKNYEIGSWSNVTSYTRSWTILTGTIYHTREIIDRDIEILLEHAELGEVNIINDEFSRVKLADKAMIDYALDKWGDILLKTPNIEFTLDPSSPWQTKIEAR